MNKLIQMILYAGIDPEDYRNCLPDIHKNNRKKLTMFLFVTIFFLTCMSLGCLFLDVIRPNLPGYVFSLILSVLLLLVNHKYTEKNPQILNCSIYIFLSILYLLGIYIGTFNFKDQPSTTFIAFLLTLPLLFALRPVQNIILASIFNILYIITVILVKNKAVISIDIINSLVFEGISMIVSSFMMHIVISNFVMKERMRYAAENDKLTRMKNRNCFEHQKSEYISLSKETLTCIYVDVNGLHELNNTQGHVAGDQMLKYIAGEMIKQFGSENCYRIGGDEFVSLVPDLDQKNLADKITHLLQAVKKENYHIAHGFETLPLENIDIDDLLKSAEEKMYRDKKKYYEDNPAIRAFR
ncbi:MAG: GGDEF domain-containing protein [Clostridia bacterium]|nr:GGDEF domain-containing protein [Clostridia bacterium]MDY5555615.1 GGDEF domain-containing protein [Blautia sp.]